VEQRCFILPSVMSVSYEPRDAELVSFLRPGTTATTTHQTPYVVEPSIFVASMMIWSLVLGIAARGQQHDNWSITIGAWSTCITIGHAFVLLCSVYYLKMLSLPGARIIPWRRAMQRVTVVNFLVWFALSTDVWWLHRYAGGAYCMHATVPPVNPIAEYQFELLLTLLVGHMFFNVPVMLSFLIARYEGEDDGHTAAS
jgi:hypothetical protein